MTLGRRQFLGRGATAVVGLGAAGALGPHGSVAAAAPPDALASIVPFAGAHQSGITAPPAPAGVAAAFDVRVDDRPALADLFRTVSDEIEHVMSGAPYAARDVGFPPLDTGVLGPTPGATGTSVLLGVGASLFDDRFGLREQRPAELIPMPHFRNDRMVTPERSHGDLSLVVQADTADAATHALRQVMRRTRGQLRLRWLREGYNVVDPHAGRGEAPGRNLLGFKDGTVNPDVGNAGELDEFVWIHPDDGQPAWAVGGTFQAIRVIRMLVEFWDRTRLSEQERIFHRHRDSGAPFGRERETDEPEFAGDLTSHIARANPRDGNSPRHTMLRRPFSYVGGLDEHEQLDQGLIFACYQRSLGSGFVAVQHRLDGEALEEYVRPLGGGFFVVLPGPAGGDHLGWQLLES